MREQNRTLVVCKPHWIRYVIPIALAAIFAIGSISYIFTGNFEDGIILLIGAVFFGVITYLISRNGSLELTHTHVVGRAGLVRTRKLMSPVSKIQDVQVNKSVLGRIFGYSTVIVSTAGTGLAEYIFKGVTNGEELQKKFM